MNKIILIFASLAFISACETENIRQCKYSCEKFGMKSYSEQTGCVCFSPQDLTIISSIDGGKQE